ncbi:MBL fold metallo-hydrolase [Colwelliaceae bacterium 6441]
MRKSMLLSVILCFLPLFGHGHNYAQTPIDTKINTDTQPFSTKDHNGYVTYLGNEALFIEVDNEKLLFDPFFHDNFGIYQLVPSEIKTNIMQGVAPYNDIDTIFISHAHSDHFAVDELITYLTQFRQTNLVASKQAIDKVKAELARQKNVIKDERLIAVDLAFGAKPWQYTLGKLTIDAVRIPHAGWPSRADVENLVFRVTINNSHTVMHMGDADPDDEHYLPYQQFWQKKVTDINFPPYWFLYSAQGQNILDNIIAAKQNMGIHVPMNVPKLLQKSGRGYFSKPQQQLHLQ